MHTATRQQQKILDCIAKYLVVQGYPPTYEEIKEALGMSTKSLVSHHLRQLETKGFLYLKPNSPRSIRLAEAPQASSFRIPVLGRIAAGEPVSFADWEQEFIELTRDIVCEQEGLYALRVQGN